MNSNWPYEDKITQVKKQSVTWIVLLDNGTRPDPDKQYHTVPKDVPLVMFVPKWGDYATHICRADEFCQVTNTESPR